MILKDFGAQYGVKKKTLMGKQRGNSPKNVP